MGHTTTGVVTAPVNTDDVKAVLGVASDDVGTLCLASNINKWNKNKPYRGTSPAVGSRTTDNAANGTGKYLGTRGAAAGFPVYWGMQYPMNTAQQIASGTGGRTTLLELCYDVAVQQGQGSGAVRYHPNYTYVRPVAGTDYLRLDDFVDYRHKQPIFMSAGVAGASPGNSKPAEMRVNKYNQETLTIFAKIPSDSVGWSFADFIPSPQTYHLVAEFYKNDTVNVWKQGSSASPFMTVKSTVNLANAGRSIGIDVPIADIMSAGGWSSTSGSFSFIVCVGFNKYSGNTAQGASAFVAPWLTGAQTCATIVTVDQASPYIVKFTKYAIPANITEAGYKDIPTTETTVVSGMMYFKGTITNNNTSTLNIYTTGFTTTGIKFRARAYGSYEMYKTYNSSHTSTGGNEYAGAPRSLKVGTKPNVGNESSVIKIDAKATKDLYFMADDLIPYGHTTNLAIEVSNDNGTTWNTTGLIPCNFKRLP